MSSNIIEMNGKKIDLSSLSDEKLIELHKNIKAQENKLRKVLEQYQERYPFLKEV